jgi:hypothetical protein
LWHIVFCNENVALPAQIPVTISSPSVASAGKSRSPRRALQRTTVNSKPENMGMTFLGGTRTVHAVYKEKSRGAHNFYGWPRDGEYLLAHNPHLCLAFHFLNTLLKD